MQQTQIDARDEISPFRVEPVRGPVVDALQSNGIPTTDQGGSRELMGQVGARLQSRLVEARPGAAAPGNATPRTPKSGDRWFPGYASSPLLAAPELVPPIGSFSPISPRARARPREESEGVVGYAATLFRRRKEPKDCRFGGPGRRAARANYPRRTRRRASSGSRGGTDC
jgi:hypothetical protein